eukprot:3678031-Amphidinium_carterae.1
MQRIFVCAHVTWETKQKSFPQLSCDPLTNYLVSRDTNVLYKSIMFASGAGCALMSLISGPAEHSMFLESTHHVTCVPLHISTASSCRRKQFSSHLLMPCFSWKAHPSCKHAIVEQH